MRTAEPDLYYTDLSSCTQENISNNKKKILAFSNAMWWCWWYTVTSPCSILSLSTAFSSSVKNHTQPKILMKNFLFSKKSWCEAAAARQRCPELKRSPVSYVATLGANIFDSSSSWRHPFRNSSSVRLPSLFSSILLKMFLALSSAVSVGFTAPAPNMS